MSQEPDYCVYIVTNHTQTVLYIGVTSDLEGRIWEHAHGESGSKFTRRYHVNTLLYYEQFGDVNAAIAREKQLKGWTRAKKEWLIRMKNPAYTISGSPCPRKVPAGGRKVLRLRSCLTPLRMTEFSAATGFLGKCARIPHPASRLRPRNPPPTSFHER